MGGAVEVLAGERGAGRGNLPKASQKQLKQHFYQHHAGVQCGWTSEQSFKNPGPRCSILLKTCRLDQGKLELLAEPQGIEQNHQTLKRASKADKSLAHHEHEIKITPENYQQITIFSLTIWKWAGNLVVIIFLKVPITTFWPSTIYYYLCTRRKDKTNCWIWVDTSLSEGEFPGNKCRHLSFLEKALFYS